MPRITVVGQSAAGRTTTARGRAARHGVPHVELDALSHAPGWQHLEVARLLSPAEVRRWQR